MSILLLINPDAVGSALLLGKCACGVGGDTFSNTATNFVSLILINELFTLHNCRKRSKTKKIPTDSPEMPYPKGITISKVWVN